MMSFVARITGLLVLLVAGQAPGAPLVMNSGEQAVTLLELYTSQGCSSCPPAERWLNDFVADENLWRTFVPVAFHVDYWDYIGWKDPYGQPANGERQRALARTANARTVYTPGIFANGREWRGWALGMAPPAGRTQPGSLAVRVADGELEAHFAADAEPWLLNVAVLGFGIDTPVTRGENRNRTLRQEFVSLVHVSHPSADGHWRVPLPAYDKGESSRRGLAVWVSRPDQPAPVQATGGWLDDRR
ncbi:MAG: DUF1223 domain-containing protein [Gammaproteobacteria bacterium]|nr:DUF1223 domain-containing protein [Gammaproteobacteria bacterium]